VNAVLTKESIQRVLETVMDPEIPTCSIVDLGMIERIAVQSDQIEIDLLPTFAGCPALDVIKEDVERTLEKLAPDTQVRVRFVMNPPWTTDRVTAAGKEALKEYGIAPAVHRPIVLEIITKPVACPYCGSTQTMEESAFGPTPCRSVLYCTSCRNPFEGFKEKRVT
jgi:ring-1,2-phenylacetyl-CoA epoxidase subunit PaaD